MTRPRTVVVECRHCDEVVSSTETVCPNCGRPMSRPSGARWLVIAGACGIALVAMLMLAPPEAKPAQAAGLPRAVEPPPAQVSAQEPPPTPISTVAPTPPPASRPPQAEPPDEAPGRETVGRWRDDRPGVSADVVIYREGKRVWMHRAFGDGSKLDTELVNNAEDVYENKASPRGDFYRLDLHDNLESWDQEGRIATFKKAEPAK